jgi:hypothetical protein
VNNKRMKGEGDLRRERRDRFSRIREKREMGAG